MDLPDIPPEVKKLIDWGELIVLCNEVRKPTYRFLKDHHREVEMGLLAGALFLYPALPQRQGDELAPSPGPFATVVAGDVPSNPTPYRPLVSSMWATAGATTSLGPIGGTIFLRNL